MMKVDVRLKLARDCSIQAYCDSQNISIDNNYDLVCILKDELKSWFDPIAVETKKVQEVSQ